MIVAGFGFRASATEESLNDAYGRAGVAEAAATLTEKAPGLFEQFAAARALRVLTVSAVELERQTTTTQSDASLAAHGTGSVAEAAALAAAGPGARLIAARVVSADGRATCALAEGRG